MHILGKISLTSVNQDIFSLILKHSSLFVIGARLIFWLFQKYRLWHKKNLFLHKNFQN